MEKSAVVYLFTGKYPYGLTIEGYLDLELKYLSKRFDKIVIVPTRGEDIIRAVPDNCEVHKPIFPPKVLFLLKGLFCCRSFRFVWGDFFKNKAFLNRKRFEVWLRGFLVTNNLLNSRAVKKIEKGLKSNDVCYYYWGKWSNVLSYFWQGKCHHVSRFHGGWDLWEEDYDNYAPFRDKIAASLDQAFFISKLGYNFFNKHYKVRKTSIASLGTADFGCKTNRNDGVVRVMSCSSIYPIKRVPLIYEAVHHYANTNEGSRVEWMHIGGGEGYESIKQLTSKNELSNLKIVLPGQTKHDKVLEYYKEFNPDVYINLSTTEGVPVAIMEAVSFNVPIVATNVGSTSEVVTDETGVLVSPNPTMEEVAGAIANVVNCNLSPREFWLKNYNAETNYGKFAEALYELSIEKQCE